MAEALNFFRSRVLLEGRWTVDGGASIKTWFVGACVFAFPNLVQRWEKERARWDQGLRAARDVSEEQLLLHGVVEDPADTAAALDLVQRELHRMDPVTRTAAVWVVFNGATQAEAGTAAGISERAVEGRFYRYAKKRREETKNAGS